ncbi:MAG TPA: DUF6519 domain-containing protein [Streptosporangiaceae bacterium]|nr:DUF6519 domain-containing protein [Streptosporangiaceae bacterium]
MDGDLKGDFSRIRFERRKNYTAVLEQQGRVALDADANEQCFIDEYLRRSEIVDVVGQYGGPACDAGFEITVANGQILIGPGRYYVDGLLCDNPASLPYDGQPFLIPAETSEILLAKTNRESVLQVYLEVWQRLITDLDDPCLREPALGQADTTARLQTVWRVVAEPVAPRIQPQVEVNTEITSCCQQMYAAAPQPATGTMSAGTSGPSADCGCEPIAAAGYQGIENQLYRVEIHEPGDETTATFKWSRENGSVVSAVTGICGSALQLSTLGPDANLGFAAQQWAELTDDSYLFGEDPNQPGMLYQIQSIQPPTTSVTLAGPVASVDPGRHARLRRWDQSGPSAASSGIPLSAATGGTWFPLENGIQVTFSNGTYGSGDYWTIPARTASGQIDWPPSDGDGNAFQRPYSTQVRRAPLACIHGPGVIVVGGGTFTVDDCRKLFRPLTAIPPAIHVEDVSWVNDDIMTVDQLAADGLTVTLDQAPSGPVTGANFIVTAEPISKVIKFENSIEPIQRSVSVVVATISVSGQTISWKFDAADGQSLQFLKTLISEGANFGLFTRMRVKLLGQMIFASGPCGLIYLDGRAFGQPALRADGTPRIDLQRPSGEGATASDLDAWFYLAPTLEVLSFEIVPSAVTVIADSADKVTGWYASSDPARQQVKIVATVTLNNPAFANTTVALDPGDATVVSVPRSITIDAGQPSGTFDITVITNPGTDASGHEIVKSFMITASLIVAPGTTQAVPCNFSVTGVQPPVNIP